MKKHQSIMGNNTLTAIHFTVTTFRITRSVTRCAPKTRAWRSGRAGGLGRGETAVTWPSPCVLAGPEPLSSELRTRHTYFPPGSHLENDTLQALSRLGTLPPLPAMLGFPVKAVLSFIYNIQEQSEIPKTPTFSPVLERALWKDKVRRLGGRVRLKVTHNGFQ